MQLSKFGKVLVGSYPVQYYRLQPSHQRALKLRVFRSFQERFCSLQDKSQLLAVSRSFQLNYGTHGIVRGKLLHSTSVEDGVAYIG